MCADAGPAEGVVGGDVGGDEGVGTAGGDDFQAVVAVLGQQGGDAGQPSARPPVFVQAIHDQDEPLALAFEMLGGLL